MTQTQSLTTLATRPSSGRKGWTLEIWDPKGQELLVTYNSLTNPGPISTGFNSRRYPNNTCGPGSFEAVPKAMIGGDPRNITKLSYDTGTKVVPVHFGYIGRAPDPRKGEVSRYELSSGKELLKNSPIRTDFEWSSTSPRDVALWLASVAIDSRHPALKAQYEGFPLTGVVIPPPEVKGTNLYEAFQAILKAVPHIEANDWGVDPEGYVVVRQATGSYTFEGDDAALKYGDRDGEQICTEATIRIANRVSEGAIVSAGYVPRLISYTHTHPANLIYSAPRFFDLPKKSDDTPILEVLRPSANTGASWGDFVSSSSASVGTVITDGNPDTYALSKAIGASGSSGSTPSIGYSPEIASNFVGYEVILDALAGDYDLNFSVLFGNQAGTTLFFSKETRNELKGKGKIAFRSIIPFPVSTQVTRATADLALSAPVAANTADKVKVYEFRSLEINVPLLSQIAQSNIRLPARQVSQITFARAVLEGGQALGGYLLETPVKTLIVKGEDGKPISCEVTEYNDTCTTTEGILTRAETGEPIRNPIVNTINDAIRRAQEAYG